MIRIAAVGDVHVDADVVGRYRPALEELPGVADVLLIAGDLTRHGTVAEAGSFATEFGGLEVPVVVVLGNHDHQSDQADEVASGMTATFSGATFRCLSTCCRVASETAMMRAARRALSGSSARW